MIAYSYEETTVWKAKVDSLDKYGKPTYENTPIHTFARWESRELMYKDTFSRQSWFYGVVYMDETADVEIDMGDVLVKGHQTTMNLENIAKKNTMEVLYTSPTPSLDGQTTEMKVMSAYVKDR